MKYERPEMEVVELDAKVMTDGLISSPNDNGGGVPELGNGEPL